MSSSELSTWKKPAYWLSLLDRCYNWVRDKAEGIAKSFIEVLITAIFTFVPFVVLSIDWVEPDGVDAGRLAAGFLGFWRAGEIVLPILGLCGAVAALLALNSGYFSWPIRVFVIVMVLVCTLGGGAALSESDGFSQDLNAELIRIGFACYAMLAFIWFLLVAKLRLTELKSRSSDQSARAILNEANRRRSRQGN